MGGLRCRGHRGAARRDRPVRRLARVGRRALASVDLPDTPVGRLRFTRKGEPTTNPVAIVRAERGGEPDDGVSTAGGTILDIVDPPTRLVAVGG